MGTSPQKSIENKIQQEFKSIKKYFDNFYGEITLVKQTYSNKLYVKIQKIFNSNIKSIKRYLEDRYNNNNTGLINLRAYYSYQVDMCSDIQNFVLIFQYFNHSLTLQLQQRKAQARHFSVQQILQIFYLMIQIIIQQRKSSLHLIVSNTHFQYRNPQKIMSLQYFLTQHPTKQQSEYKQMGFQGLIRNRIYLSPQAWLLFCRKQFHQSYRISSQENSLVFSLGLNFMEILLLKDIIYLYEPHQVDKFDEIGLRSLLEQIRKINQQIYFLIRKMTSKKVQQRPSLQQIRDYLKMSLKSLRIQLTQLTTIDTLNNQKF